MKAVFRPRVLFFVIVGAIAAAPALVIGAALLGTSGAGPLWLGAGILVALVAPAARTRCTLREDGLEAVNYFRSHHVRWDDIASLVLETSPFLLGGYGLTSTPLCRTRTGGRFWVMALWEAPVRRADEFQTLIDEKATEYGFDARVAWGYARG